MLVGIAWINPRSNIPVVSPTVCAVRGLATDAAWYDGDLAPAGCYDVSPDASSTSSVDSGTSSDTYDEPAVPETTTTTVVPTSSPEEIAAAQAYDACLARQAQDQADEDATEQQALDAQQAEIDAADAEAEAAGWTDAASERCWQRVDAANAALDALIADPPVVVEQC